jgi:undecaprenyl-diphosphatase
MFAVGFVVSFLAALVVVRGFLVYVSRHSFAAFAWYRIGFGILLLLFMKG